MKKVNRISGLDFKQISITISAVVAGIYCYNEVIRKLLEKEKPPN